MANSVVMYSEIYNNYGLPHYVAPQCGQKPTVHPVNLGWMLPMNWYVNPVSCICMRLTIGACIVSVCSNICWTRYQIDH